MDIKTEIEIQLERDVIVEALNSLNNNGFLNGLSKVITNAINYVLDGRSALDSMEACEKTFIGTKVEKRFLEYFNLPGKTKGSTQALDTIIAGIDVDLKFTLGSNWMIPPEAVGKWCLLIQTDYSRSVFSVGLLKMISENLTLGGNRDSKKTVNKLGKTRIHWIGQDVALAAWSMDHVNNDFVRIAALAEEKSLVIDSNITRSSGTYMVYHRDKIVYIGTTKDIRNRVRSHLRTIRNCATLNIEDFSFKLINCNSHLMSAIESYLIAKHKPSWNNTGFGSNSLGSNRKNQKKSVWNQLYGSNDEIV